MNQYFIFTLPGVPGALINAVIYNEEMQNITEGFDQLPSASRLMDGTLIYDKSDGSSSHTSVLVDSSSPGTYVRGEQVAVQMNIGNNSNVTMSVNGRGQRPIIFDIFGGAVAEDLRDTGIYTVVFDNNRWYSLEMSPRGIIASQRFIPTAQAAIAEYLAKAYGGSAVNSIEFFPAGTLPTSQYPHTTWDQLPDTVASLTDGMISSTDLNAWIRRT